MEIGVDIPREGDTVEGGVLAWMKADPFAFLRGAAAVMAVDLASAPATGLRVQSCGSHEIAAA